MSKLIFLTAYDFLTAQIIEESNIDGILVGDSLGMVFEGKSNTHEVTIEQMCYHTQAVKKGAPKTFVIGDMPINTYHTPAVALENAKKIIQAGADAVKLEGGFKILPQIKTLIKNQIKVIGHIGLTPQTATTFHIVGKDQTEAEQLIQDSQILDQSGIEFLVLECIPKNLAQKITESIKTPTIGIGAGPHCNGQILVFQDLIGLTSESFRPKFLKRYLNSRKLFKQSIQKFKKEVIEDKFPKLEHSYE